MAKMFECSLTKTYSFNLRADSEEDALCWLQTHDLNDVAEITSRFDVGYSESCAPISDNEEAAIDIP